MFLDGYCENCEERLTTEEEEIMGYCDKCRTFCERCDKEITGEASYQGMCGDCWEEYNNLIDDSEEGYNISYPY